MEKTKIFCHRFHRPQTTLSKIEEDLFLENENGGFVNVSTWQLEQRLLEESDFMNNNLCFCKNFKMGDAQCPSLYSAIHIQLLSSRYVWKMCNLFYLIQSM